MNFSPSDNLELNFDSKLKGIDITDLKEIEQTLLQDKLDNLLEIITIDDETPDPPAIDNELGTE